MSNFKPEVTRTAEVASNCRVGWVITVTRPLPFPPMELHGCITRPSQDSPERSRLFFIKENTQMTPEELIVLETQIQDIRRLVETWDFSS